MPIGLLPARSNRTARCRCPVDTGRELKTPSSHLQRRCGVSCGRGLICCPDQNRYFHKLLLTNANLLRCWCIIWVLVGPVAGHRSLCRTICVTALAAVLGVVYLCLLVFPLDYIRVQYFSLTVGGISGVLKHRAVLLPDPDCPAAFVPVETPMVSRGVAADPLHHVPSSRPGPMLKIFLLCCNVMQLRQCTDTAGAPPLLPTSAGQPRILCDYI